MSTDFRVFRFAGTHIVVVILILTAWAGPQPCSATSFAKHPRNPSYIIVGFVGGFVRHTNAHHGPVVLAAHIRQSAPEDSFVHVYENRHRKDALRNIVSLVDTDHDGTLSNDEKSAARIILFGQSWGASAAVMLARDLDRIGIPVLLTVQVDSVRKPWQQDGLIPDNVAQAVNFYQPHGLVHGRQVIRAADEYRTQIIGNFRFDYKQTPVKCNGMSWLDRAFTPDHMQSECDPRLWSQVENFVRQQFKPEPEKFATSPVSSAISVIPAQLSH